MNFSTRNIHDSDKDKKLVIRHLKHYLAKHPYHVVKTNHLATIYLESKRFQEACYLLRKLHSRVPYHLQTLNNLAKAYLGLNKYEQAEKLLKRVLTQRPDHIEAMLSFGRSKQAQGQFILAISYFQRITEINPNCIDAFIHSVECYQKAERLQEAVAITQTAIQHNPYHPTLLVLHYQLLIKLGLVEQAEDHKRQISNNPEVAQYFDEEFMRSRA